MLLPPRALHPIPVILTAPCSSDRTAIRFGLNLDV